MKDATRTTIRDDLIGIALAMLMFALQGAMVLSMSSDDLATTPAAPRGGMIAAAGFDAGGRLA
jgi:hypothetical protein